MRNEKRVVEEFQLENGLKIFVKEDHRAPLVSLQIWYGVGSADENLGCTGLSHLLEHMMFKGTKNYSAGQFDKIIAELGGQQNAYTSQDLTVYTMLLPPEGLAKAFELEADRMSNLSMEKESFNKELQVVIEERRMRVEDNPQSLTVERFMAAANLERPYHHPIIGWMEDIEKISLEQANRWYEAWYVPNNAFLVVVGDVKPQEVYQLTEKFFGPIKSKSIPDRKPNSGKKSQVKRELIVKAHAELPWMILGFNVPNFQTFTEAWESYALQVLAGVLDGGKSARLEKHLIREKRVALEVGASFFPYCRYNTQFMLEGVPANDISTKQLESYFLDEIKVLQNHLITPEELSKVKAQVVANHIYEKDDITVQANEIGCFEILGISWREGEEFSTKIEAVTDEQVRDVARKYLLSQTQTLAILEPLQTVVEVENERAKC